MNKLKFFFVSCLCVGMYSIAYAQSNADINSYSEIKNFSGRPLTATEISNNTSLLSANWQFANITFNNHQFVRNVPVKFNIEKNELYFLKDGTNYAFTQPVNSFQLNLDVSNASNISYFINGFPPVQNNDATTFYQVLVDGNFQLLKLPKKNDSNNYTDSLYAYNASTRSISAIKNKSSLVKAFPQYASAIEKFCSSKNFKLNTEEELITLFNFLSQ